MNVLQKSITLSTKGPFKRNIVFQIPKLAANRAPFWIMFCYPCLMAEDGSTCNRRETLYAHNGDDIMGQGVVRKHTRCAYLGDIRRIPCRSSEVVMRSTAERALFPEA